MNLKGGGKGGQNVADLFSDKNLQDLVSSISFTTTQKNELSWPKRMAEKSNTFSPITFPARLPLKVSIFTVNMQRLPYWQPLPTSHLCVGVAYLR